LQLRLLPVSQMDFPDLYGLIHILIRINLIHQFHLPAILDLKIIYVLSKVFLIHVLLILSLIPIHTLLILLVIQVNLISRTTKRSDILLVIQHIFHHLYQEHLEILIPLIHPILLVQRTVQLHMVIILSNIF